MSARDNEIPAALLKSELTEADGKTTYVIRIDKCCGDHSDHDSLRLARVIYDMSKLDPNSHAYSVLLSVARNLFGLVSDDKIYVSPVVFEWIIKHADKARAAKFCELVSEFVVREASSTDKIKVQICQDLLAVFERHLSAVEEIIS